MTRREFLCGAAAGAVVARSSALPLGLRTGEWRGKQLPYDAKVEWLQGDGNAFIDLSFNLFGGRDDVHVKIGIEAVGCSFFGARTSGTVKSFAAHYNIEGGSPSIVELVNNGSATGQWAAYYANRNNVYDIFFNTSSQKVLLGNDVVQDFVRARADVFETDYTAYLFWAHGGTLGNNGKSHDKIYKCNIVRDGADFIDLIPVKFTNETGVSEGAMYDRVSGQLFRNQGDGAFIIGPDK